MVGIRETGVLSGGENIKYPYPFQKWDKDKIIKLIIDSGFTLSGKSIYYYWRRGYYNIK